MVTPSMQAVLLNETPAATAEPSAAVRFDLPEVAVIRKSASTNTAAYTIAVTPTGSITVRMGSATQSISIAQALAVQLYADLERAGALGALPVEHCMRSASFGTTTSIAYRGESSPDLECAQDASGRALQADAQAIARAAVGLTLPHRRWTQPVHIKARPDGGDGPAPKPAHEVVATVRQR